MKVKTASQVDLTVLTREDEVSAARLSVRYPHQRESATVFLTATEMDALVSAWQRERRRVTVSERTESERDV